ncbi:MAG: hypothetical protein EOP62_23790 [Sphingomonadales bacterium]|nr:MAG: hypothetical protein EOP62_23790 [Sphingomonadales bacterium]
MNHPLAAAAMSVILFVTPASAQSIPERDSLKDQMGHIDEIFFVLSLGDCHSPRETRRLAARQSAFDLLKARYRRLRNEDAPEQIAIVERVNCSSSSFNATLRNLDRQLETARWWLDREERGEE